MNHLDNGPSSYAKLAEALRGAYDQASKGKGRERHATDEAFEDQKICVISRWIKDSPIAGVLFQGIKKAVESSRLPPDRAIRELQGAINYLAAGIILLEEQETFDVMERLKEMGEKYEAELREELDTLLFSEAKSKKSEHRVLYDPEEPDGRFCIRCEYSELPQDEMPCKKCFNLDLKPHFKRVSDL